MASCRVGSRRELWDILMQVQLCHPLDPVGGNTSIVLHLIWFSLGFVSSSLIWLSV